jgi:selenide,water dikinase
MMTAGAEAATDITGFGLLGHLQRMLHASGVAARIEAPAIPVLPGVLGLARQDIVPGGTQRNRAYLRSTVEWGALTKPEQLVLADAQTSGGLLIATRDPDRLSRELDARGVHWWDVGEAVEGPPGRIEVSGRLATAHD